MEQRPGEERFVMASKDNKIADNARQRVLVVDDDPTVCRSITRALDDTYQVDQVFNAKDALTLLEANQYVAIISDFEMPGHDGIWLLSQAKALYPDIRRILHSGSDPVDVASHRESGLVERFLSKPTEFKELRNALP